MSTVIASATWEGRHNECPVCGHESWAEPSITAGDAPCPHCGHLLWYGEPSPLDRESAVSPSPRATPRKRHGRSVRQTARAIGRLARDWVHARVAAAARPRRVAIQFSGGGVYDKWLDG